MDFPANEAVVSFHERIGEMCRACMSLKCDSTYSLYIDDMKKLFTDCTSIQIDSNDGLPDQLCNICHEQLSLWNNFKNHCIEIDLKMRQIILSELSLDLIKGETNNEDLVNVYDEGSPAEEFHDCNKGFNTDCFDGDNLDEEVLQDTIARIARKKLKKSRSRLKLRKKIKHKSINDNYVMCKSRGKNKKKIIFNVLPGEQIETNDDGESVKIKCKLCNKHFYLTENLKEHMKVHEGKTIPECDICYRKFKSIESLRCHKLSHADVKKYSCKICGKSFLFNYVLTHHLGTHTGTKTIPCDQCGKTFRTKTLLESHMQVHSEETPYSCEICSKKFKRSYGLKVHLMRCKGEKNYTCVECGKSFAVNADLKVHLRSHTGEKPFPCDFCSKRFRTHSHMTLHRRNHTGDRPHPCTSCPMKFMTKKALKMHYLIHTGELPHSCSICSRPFRQKSALRTHMKTHNIASSDMTPADSKS